MAQELRPLVLVMIICRLIVPLVLVLGWPVLVLVFDYSNVDDHLLMGTLFKQKAWHSSLFR